VERDLAGVGLGGGLAVVGRDEPGLVQGRAPAVKHDIEPDAVLRRVDIIGDDDGIRLERAIDL
jgi:hypothetical protein